MPLGTVITVKAANACLLRTVKIGKKDGISNDQKITFSKCDLHTQTNSAYNTSREMHLFFQSKIKKPVNDILCSTVGWSRASGHSPSEFNREVSAWGYCLRLFLLNHNFLHSTYCSHYELIANGSFVRRKTKSEYAFLVLILMLFFFNGVLTKNWREDKFRVHRGFQPSFLVSNWNYDLLTEPQSIPWYPF